MNWQARIRNEFARLGKPADESVVEEMAQHASAAVEAARADGMTAAEAEAASIALIQSWCSQTSGPARIARAPLLESAPPGRSLFTGLWLDIRLALRLMRRQPGFALVSITLIALAIAATTSIFSVVNSVVLKPLPSVKVDGLVRVFEYDARRGRTMPVLSNSTYYAWHDTPETIEGLAAWDDWPLSYEGPSGLELVRGARITANLFPLVGVSPAFGVNFTEEQEITDDAIILSHGFWQERFGGDVAALGTSLTLGGRARTIIGVMPRGFQFPDRLARVWLAARPPTVIESVATRGFGKSVTLRFSFHNGLARLKPGVTPERAAAEVAARVADAFKKRRLDASGPFADGGTVKVALTPMLDWMIKDVKPALWILSAAVLLLFAAAIGNVANMQLSRAAARQREVAIRSAIGASSRRLVRHLLVETSMIAAMGAAAGLAITATLLRLLPTLMPEDFPRLDDIAIDGRVVGAAAGLSVAVALITCLMPARLARRVNLTSALAEDGAAPVGLSQRSPAARSRGLIIAGQVAIAALLLVGAGLLSQSFVKLMAIDRGYQPANLLTARLSHFSQSLPTAARSQFYDDVLTRLRSLPGVTNVALSDELPLTPGRRLGEIPGNNPVRPGQPLEGAIHVVSTDYVDAMGMTLLRGQNFATADERTSELVILVNQSFAKRYIPGEPLGASISLDLDGGRPCEPTKAVKSACTNRWRVVGILADVRQSGADAPAQPEIFASRSQFLSAMPATQYVAARTTGDPAALASDLRAIVTSASSRGVVEEVMTMDTRLMTSLARPRLYAVLLGGFAVFGLLIAMIGLFGGLSYVVAQRTREFGVRTALGASPRDIVILVIRQGTILTISGLVAGFGIAAATVRYLAQFLFGVAPLDPATFAVVGAVLTATALVACAIPARRAARIDAIEALRR
jgi:putative ABC transport system permease protein